MRAALVLALLLAWPAHAITPDEQLADPAQEQRAREIGQQLRCLVCQNESIDESNATFARDLRALVREQISAGKSNDEVIAFVVDRFGEYVLLRPRATGSTLVLWAIGPAFLLIALAGGAIYLRSRRPNAQANSLSEAEQARLREILDE